jgi:brefeldin A-resistance guanine nucleotide exchange factor 1
VFDHIAALLSQAQWFSILLVERAVVGLLKLCRLAASDVRNARRGYVRKVNLISPKPILHDQMFVSLDALGGLPPDVLNAVAEQLIAGLTLLMQHHRAAITSVFVSIEDAVC